MPLGLVGLFSFSFLSFIFNEFSAENSELAFHVRMNASTIPNMMRSVRVRDIGVRLTDTSILKTNSVP